MALLETRRRDISRPSLSTQHIILIILLVSVLIRLGCAFYLGNNVVSPPLLNDQLSYHTLAIRLLAGQGFSFPTGWYPYIPAGQMTAFWSFGYPIFLAAVYSIFGVHPLAARLIQAVLGGLLVPWLVYRLTRRAFALGDKPGAVSQNEVVPLLAAAGSAVYLYFALYAATLMTETFYIAALLFATERALALATKPAVRTAIGLGIGLGVATLMRQSILPWVVVLFAWLLWAAWRRGYARRMLGGLAVAGALLLLAILPFTIRNYLVYGQFLLLNSNAGYAMYSAQHPMHGTHFMAYVAAPMPADVAGQSEPAMDRELMQRGIGFVLADPGRYLLLSLSRVADYFEFWPDPGTSLINNIGRVGSFGLYLPFMLYGLWLALRRTARQYRDITLSPVFLLTLFIVVYALMHIFTWAMGRYRLPADAIAMSFVGLALHDLYLRLASRRNAKVASVA